MASFSLEMPVLVSCSPAWPSSSAERARPTCVGVGRRCSVNESSASSARPRGRRRRRRRRSASASASSPSAPASWSVVVVVPRRGRPTARGPSRRCRRATTTPPTTAEPRGCRSGRSAMIGRPTASTIGQYDGDGRWTSVGVAGLDDVLGGGDAHQAAVARPRRTCGARTRRGACTIGISSKLYAGGGDGIIHSSVRASHGSGPASAGSLGLAPGCRRC